MYTYICVPQLGLLNDCVESGNQADAMVADDHNPRREVAYGNSNIPSKWLFMFKTGTCLLYIKIMIYKMECSCDVKMQ